MHTDASIRRTHMHQKDQDGIMHTDASHNHIRRTSHIYRRLRCRPILVDLLVDCKYIPHAWLKCNSYFGSIVLRRAGAAQACSACKGAWRRSEHRQRAPLASRYCSTGSSSHISHLGATPPLHLSGPTKVFFSQSFSSLDV